MKKYFKRTSLMFCAIIVLVSITIQSVQAQNCNEPTYPNYMAWKRYDIEGYPSRTNPRQGDQLQLMIATGNRSLNNATYKIEIYRVGATDSLYLTINNLTLHEQPLHDSVGNSIWPGDYNRKPKDYKRGCDWPVSYTLNIPSNWKSGFYYAKCSLTSSPFSSRRIPFVIRQATPGSFSKTLYIIPFSTYHAYASWGGGNFYWGNDNHHTVDSTDTLSFLRPLGGFIGSDNENDLGTFDELDRNFIVWAEQNGYTMEYCSNLDLKADENIVNSYRTIVIAGHHEYWSRNERDAIERKFISENGGNVAFLSANICYWYVAYIETDSKMWCHKRNNVNEWDETNLWRNQPEGPEGKFMGVQYVYGTYNIVKFTLDTIRNSSHWIFRGTGLQNGSAFGFGSRPTRPGPGIVGEEFDRIYPEAPENLVLLSSALAESTHYNGDCNSTELHQSTFYINESSNSRVFAAGTVCGATDSGAMILRTGLVSEPLLLICWTTSQAKNI